MDTISPKALTPQAAYDMTQQDKNAMLIDIRSSMEFLFVGHPVGAIHIPWIDEPDWVENPNFVAEIRKLRTGQDGKDGYSRAVILICRSGKRSHEAGMRLLEAGVEDVWHIDEGFEGELNEQHQRSSVGGWRFRGLPWEQC